MHKPIPFINWSAPILFVILTQLITLAVLGMNLMSLGLSAETVIAQLPPVTFLYSAADVGWIGAGRSVGHMVSIVMNTAIGLMCIIYGVGRKLRIIKFITILMGIQFLISTLISISIIGVISVGGWWHVFSLVAAIAVAIAATATAVMFGLVRTHLRDLGVAYDAYVDHHLEEVDGK